MQVGEAKQGFVFFCFLPHLLIDYKKRNQKFSAWTQNVEILHFYKVAAVPTDTINIQKYTTSSLNIEKLKWIKFFICMEKAKNGETASS